MTKIDPTDQAVLNFLYQAKHATVNELRKHVLGSLSRAQCYRKLARLEQDGYIAAEVLLPERGNGSPRLYHLLLKGARALGQTALSSQHYRKPTREVYQAQHVRHELAVWAEHYEWRLLTTEKECRAALLGVLTSVAQARFGERFPSSTIHPVNLKVSPDLLLDTGNMLVLVIVGHPQASAAFWSKRLLRYEPLLHAVRVACFALTEHQQHDAAQAIAASQYKRRCLLLNPDQVEALVHRLAEG